jgi:DNA mismatch repair protein MutS2
LYHQEREQEILLRILRRLSDRLRGEVGLIREAAKVVGQVEALLACAEFAARQRGVVPQVEVGVDLRFREARHPLLVQTLGFEQVVPISVALGGADRVLIISGPNTGGKTVALKTMGLLAAMAQAGLPVPAAEAEVPVFRDILADIGDRQSLAQHLSTFSAHVLCVQRMLERLSPPALILIDELGAGTDPAHGAALGIAIVDAFRRRQATVVATTHHQAVKQFAFSTAGVQNASVELDPITLRPTFELKMGIAGGSSGIEIASQLGLSDAVVEQARRLLSGQDLQAERYLQQLREALAGTQRQEEALREEQARLGSLEAQRFAENREKEALRQKGFETAVEQWATDFRQAGERFLKDLKDRFEGARLRKQLKQREALLKEEFRRRMQSAMAGAGRPEASEGVTEVKTWRPGDEAYHRFLRKPGRVVMIDGADAVLEIDGKRVTAGVEQLEIPAAPGPARVLPANVTLNVVEETEPELNLIGCTVDEAIPRLDKFLDRAFISCMHEVRIIHGFGTGKLREAVSIFLRDHPHVVKHRVEGGATVATIRQ